MPRRSETWKRNFGRVEFFMRQAAEEGLSFSQFYRVAREQGISYRREWMLADWRQVKGVFRFEQALSRLRPETVIPSHMITRVNPNQRANYLVGVKFERFDPVTQEYITDVRVISSARLMEAEHYLRPAELAYSERGPYPDPSARNFRIAWVTAKSEELRR